MNGCDSPCCFRSSPRGDIRALIELNSDCNLKCSWCHSHGGSSARMSYTDACSALNALKRLGVKGVIFSGGEPLLWRWLPSLLEHASNMGFQLDLCTNATLIDDEAAVMLRAYLSEVSVSLDSYIPQRHDVIRGVSGAWEKAVGGIRALTTAGLTVHATMMVCDQNAGDIDGTLWLLSKLGVPSVALLGLMGSDGVFRLSANTRKTLSESLESIRLRYPSMVVHTKRILAMDPGDACPAGRTFFGIDRQGRLLPCPLFKSGEAGIPLAEATTLEPRLLQERLLALAAGKNAACYQERG